MLTLDELAGVRVKIERTKKHIADLRQVSDPTVFITTDSRPYRTSVEVNRQTGKRVVCLRAVESLDLTLGAIAGDAFHNLRSALDLLMWQLVLANGGTPGQQTEFPIRRTKEKFETVLPGCVQGSAAEVATLLQTLKPYEGGNDALWAIHIADIVDKHRVLIPAAAVVHAILIPDNVPVDENSVRTVPNRLPDREPIFPAEDGTVLLTLDDSEMNVNPYAMCEIAFSEPEVVAGESMVPTLTQLTDEVEGVVEAFAALA